MKHIPAQWDTCKLKDVALIGDGAHASIQRIDKGILYLTSKNFGADRLDLSKVDYITEDDYNNYFKKKSKALTKPEAGDILLGIIGTLGAPYLVKEDDFFGLSSSVSIIRPDSEKLYANFLYYWFKTPIFQNAINQIKSGVAQSFLSLAMIGSLPCVYPQSIEAQQKIATILSAYDDLIESNLKRIKLLEEMAQITYEEWFVRLKFPGHETMLMDSETGLPIGWSNTKLGNYIKFHKGKKLDEIFDNQVPDSSKILLLDSLENGVYKYALSKGHVKTIRGDLIMLMDGARSSWVFFAENGIVGSTISKITSEKIPLTLLYQFFKCHLEWLQINNTGAAIPHANKQFINRINFKLASDDVLNLWRETIDPTYQCIWNLKDQNQFIKEARDILLPRLMTGMIDVERLELPNTLQVVGIVCDEIN